MHDNVNHPVHYQPLFEMKPLECIDITRHMSFTWGNAFKYVWRAGSKGDKAKMIEDLRKARWYIWHSELNEAPSKIAEEKFCLLKCSAENETKFKILCAIVSHENKADSMIVNWLSELGYDSSQDQFMPDSAILSSLWKSMGDLNESNS